jgi:hypothetical protein
VSPIFVRPVREQLEHDRLIRHLQGKYKRKFEVAVNLGEEKLAPVKIGQVTLFPDLVLNDGKKLAGVVEVESSESVNNLEAMAQWVHFSRARVPFHLYVPVTMFEAARRLCEAHHARVSEIWTYRPALDGFDLVRMSADAGAAKAGPPRAATPPKTEKIEKPNGKAKPVADGKPATNGKPAARPAKSAKPAPAARSDKKPAPAKKAAKPKGKPAKRKR